MRSASRLRCLGLLWLALELDRVLAVVSLPNLEFNAATGQNAYASSYFKFDLNPVLDSKYIPNNGIDGLVVQSSWWSSGKTNESVFFQVNFTAESPVISKVVLRWHGYLAAKAYTISTSYSGYNRTFVLYNTYENASTVWDRVDVVRPASNSSARFYYLRVDMLSPASCDPNNVLGCSRRLADQGPIYGIRELEVWSASQLSGAVVAAPSSLLAVMLLSIVASL
ncbi:hypothetical protein SPRG_07285 [Saprolegnia parasitica CBS 223.65]|uniref:F5/8 type C domain-containing protein n=1 Tax=Saprolegnia parasitica (strain CBS 223.65) TaxID=695850 RepID=A0A067CN77_SAPPC|nr:hypothetical protein SPRG_07285 [Saprolegnia parasitica CBS 223.65]KDO28006.1 hypothetical protein SPRG_07285 [Saprolegnia parasitica CBS 223.65]|eukprot:XP_012201454.1 hypothetical protein SPRG_07285 [Saprolegnia parasitica CBS 223.65]